MKKKKIYMKNIKNKWKNQMNAKIGLDLQKYSKLIFVKDVLNLEEFRLDLIQKKERNYIPTQEYKKRLIMLILLNINNCLISIKHNN